ncbi:uncharacterized protein Gasu_16660 [Galdieria sulphuraria]|uniref:Uncharacterized protein n=1 Tax=Galdieria sulphuraria TaxID=130081 RepID=M2Y5D0_GALSU|nr:uncharacterized protein Gasu_16660 [Galdieria sulphuraria]EME31173.1 hypothetical protein Gasu_16660 [Galdieria sulphuraria]|eukprot:XP_005707693.1 hypothetical protein Gasu_16660 [Galdieria sulphuraria]
MIFSVFCERNYAQTLFSTSSRTEEQMTEILNFEELRQFKKQHNTHFDGRHVLRSLLDRLFLMDIRNDKHSI